MLLCLWQALSDGEPTPSVESLADAVAGRVGAAHRVESRRSRWLHDLVAADEIEAVDEVSNQERALEAREWMGRIDAMMQDLESIDRSLIELRLLGCDCREIHEATGASKAMIQHRLDRILRRLQIKLMKSGYQASITA